MHGIYNIKYAISYFLKIFYWFLSCFMQTDSQIVNLIGTFLYFFLKHQNPVIEVVASEIHTPLSLVKVRFLRSFITASKQVSNGTEVFFLSA
jgi:hypothetical protein